MPNAIHVLVGATEPHEALRRALGVLFDVSLYAYLVATIVLAVWFFWRRLGLLAGGLALLGLGLVTQVGYIAVRWIAAGRPPFADTFETLILLSACLAAILLAMAWGREWRGLSPLAALVGLMVTVYASLIMPDDIEPLLPALQDSFWLTVHVVICIVSYAAFFLAYVGALAFLAREPKHAKGAAFVLSLTVTSVVAAIVVAFLRRREDWHAMRTTALLVSFGAAVAGAFALWPVVGIADRGLALRERLPGKDLLERMTYKAVALGFPFLTLGIITGSVWADQAWGRYWGWDPKETASLITWLVFAVYLHLRLVPKWRGPWVAWVAAGGVWCVLFTFFGVNLLGGLHAFYAT